MTTTQTTIYGASDDLIEFDGAIYGEHNGDDGDVILTAPNGERLELTVAFCSGLINSDGWGIRIDHNGQQAPWPITFSTRPGDDRDPAVTITHPEGTTATCNGEDVA